MKGWAGEAALRVASGETVALITITAAAGSTPREAGAAMLVLAEGTRGTIGGGALEHRAAAQARALMATPRGFVVQDYPLGPLLNQCCGGYVQLLIQTLNPASLVWLAAAAEAEDAGGRLMLRLSIGAGGLEHTLTASGDAGCFAADGARLKRLGLRPAIGDHVVLPLSRRAPDVMLFGAGHIGRALAPILATLPFRTIWLDERRDALPALRPAGVIAIDREIVAAADRMEPGAYVLVMTHDHDLDYQIVAHVLARGDAAYCGMIGSATKAARFVKRLERDGIDPAGLTSPLGASLQSKEPAVIAVAAAAEILMLREARAKTAAAARVAHPCAC